MSAPGILQRVAGEAPGRAIEATDRPVAEESSPIALHRHIVIEQVEPNVDGGLYPAKRVVGEPCVVKAHIFRDGPHVLRAVVRWRKLGAAAALQAPMTHLGNDEWSGIIPIDSVGRIEFWVEAWTDELATWTDWVRRKAAAGEELKIDLLEGVEIAARFLRDTQDPESHQFAKWLKDIQSFGNDTSSALANALDLDFGDRWTTFAPPETIARSQTLELHVEPRRAMFGAWYELFPRSQGTDPNRSATLREAEARLPAIRDMGFDVLYLPPIHPIGTTHRKGRNNAVQAAPGDPGSPWQIGNTSGGHTAVEPALGTIDDFDHFVATSTALGLEVALDFAAQCSPDHPWVTEHPEWFAHRPDGTIKYAENPPKKYQDIYPINFDTSDEVGLWTALLDVVKFWIDHGVRIFRVDNPHTKPVRFWAWLIREIRREYPDIIFLAEAFTRPKMMKMLAKVGFSQSYTYFTWRNTKAEIIEYMTELAMTGAREYFRPNFFANTPDILPPILQHGGRPAFKMRLVLAATLSPTYGIYSGYELVENAAVPNSEEYLDSEKYQIKIRDWNQPGNLNEFVARLNSIRRNNSALQELANIRFLPTNSDQLLAYVKMSSDRSNTLLIVVNLDPFHPHEGVVHVPPDSIVCSAGSAFNVHDLLSGAHYSWAEHNYVRLDPSVESAHVFRVETIQ